MQTETTRLACPVTDGLWLMVPSQDFTHIDYRDDLALCCLDRETDDFAAVAHYFSLNHDRKHPNHKTIELAVLVRPWPDVGASARAMQRACFVRRLVRVV